PIITEAIRRTRPLAVVSPSTRLDREAVPRCSRRPDAVEDRIDFCGSQAALCGRKLPLRSRRVAPPEILGQIDDVAALASAEDLQHCVELAAQLGDLLIALCQQCSDAVGDAVDEFLFGKWSGVGLRGRRAGVFLWLGGLYVFLWLGGQQPVGWPAFEMGG